MKIAVYGTTQCPWTEKVLDILKEHNKKATFYNIQEPSNRQQLFLKTGQYGTPVTDIQGKVLVGFDRAALEKELMANK